MNHRKVKTKKTYYSNSSGVFGVTAILYFMVGTLANLMGWQHQDKAWLVALSHYLPTFDPWSHLRIISIAPPNGAGYCCPPLLLLLIYPFVIIGGKLGWSQELVTQVYSSSLFLVDIATIFLITKIIKKFRPTLSTSTINTVIILLFFSGFYLFTSGFMGHPETLVVFFSLLAIQTLDIHRYWLAGLLFGIAFAAKQSAIFIFLPIWMLLANRNLNNSIRLGIATSLTFLAFVAPFFLIYPRETWYGIIGYTQQMIIRGPSLWWFIDAISRRVLLINTFSEPLTILANTILLATITTLSILYIKLRKGTSDKLEIYGLTTLILLASNILSKWVFFRHHLPGFVFLMLWDTLRRKNHFPAFATTYAFLIFVSFFIYNPLWEFAVLSINIIAFAVVFHSLFKGNKPNTK